MAFPVLSVSKEDFLEGVRSRLEMIEKDPSIGSYCVVLMVRTTTKQRNNDGRQRFLPRRCNMRIEFDPIHPSFSQRASMKYGMISCETMRLHVRAMVLARLAQSACHGHDFPVSQQQALRHFRSVACHELDVGSGIHSVRQLHFRMDYAAVLRDFRYRSVLFSGETECLRIR